MDEADRGLAEGEYFPAGFSAEGFTHCSFAHQVVRVANTRYQGRSDLVLLEIDRRRVTHRVVIENTHGGDEVFPHVYGGLTRDAVVRVHGFSPAPPDGIFVLPGSVSGIYPSTR